MLTTATEAERDTTTLSLALRGTIDGVDLSHLGDTLDQTDRTQVTTVLVDVSGLESWSLLAQAMVLSTARRLGDRGCRLVLCGPSTALRRQSRRLDIFGRLSTRASTYEVLPSAELSRTVTIVAPLILDDRRLLLVRKHDDRQLHLPGGSIKRSENPYTALVRHLSRQLGLILDPASVQARMTVHAVSGHRPHQVSDILCFQVPQVDIPAALGEVQALEWATPQTPEVTAGPREIMTILQYAGYVD